MVATLAARGAVVALNRLAHRAIATWDDRVLLSERRPVRLLLLAGLVELGSTQLALPARADQLIGHLAYTALVVGVAWMLLGAINTGSDVYQGSLPDDTVGELRSRSIRTRLAVARSVGSVLLLLASAAVLLMQFEVVRSVGVSLLASAGVAGVVLGFAAQKSLGGVIAGLQISIAQPVRIGDLIFYEGEVGTIEEINLTFVVIHLWDERRLIVPIAKFLETTLHNWSRGDKPLLAWVTLHADPTLPVPALRAAHVAYCQGDPRCDGRDVALRVTDMTPDTITLRAHASCASAVDVFELRWAMREALVRALADLDGGSYLPRRRQVEFSSSSAEV
ncbi:MAG: mechanosensitive ion channel [Myxococcales bacterium]|nr:MAG: mechanosensitive ion channel [Myxococcales bacterium]